MNNAATGNAQQPQNKKGGSKRWALYTGVFFLVLAVLGYVFRAEVLGSITALYIGPEHQFAEQPPPSKPNYDQSEHWAALPGKTSPALDRPAAAGAPAATTTPVFFVHPTTYFGKASWNQPLDDEDANWLVDQRVLRHQASAFNSCCSIYAPRYRQATFYSFIENADNAESALNLAYSDVLTAFESFLDRIPAQQPFILAGHSQGTKHAARLLAEKIANTPLAARMIAAYLVGFSVTPDDLGGTAVCATRTQTGCAIGWNAIDGNGRGIFPGISDLLCVNPLNWQTDGSYAAHEQNTGAIGYAAWGPEADGEDITAMAVETGAADAQCKNGQLFVPELRSTSFPQRMQGNSMHTYDYSLFHMNIRQNALDRVTAFRDS